MSLRIGIGSWTDADYAGIVFPERTPAAGRLAGYAKTFDHVEVNSSYYAVPKRETVAGWAQQTPRGFTFHLKLHRAFSQSPAKAATSDGVMRLLERIEPLVDAKKLGVFLLVLPPSFAPERRGLDELDSLVEKLHPHRLAVELRHRDWVTGARGETTMAYFRSRKLVWVAVDMPRIAGSPLMPEVDEVTHPTIAYLRLHGRNKFWLRAKSAAERHYHRYTSAELKRVAARIGELAGRARDVYVVANNHASDFAPRAALALQAMLQHGAKNS